MGYLPYQLVQDFSHQQYFTTFSIFFWPTSRNALMRVAWHRCWRPRGFVAPRCWWSCSWMRRLETMATAARNVLLEATKTQWDLIFWNWERSGYIYVHQFKIWGANKQKWWEKEAFCSDVFVYIYWLRCDVYLIGLRMIKNKLLLFNKSERLNVWHPQKLILNWNQSVTRTTDVNESLKIGKKAPSKAETLWH